jgi:hypothetical protein
VSSVVCGSTDPNASFRRLPSDPVRRVYAFGLEDGQLKAKLVGTFRPLQSNHHLNAGTEWDSNGSRVAPGISVAVRVTETGQTRTTTRGLLVSCRHRWCSHSQFSVILRRILTPRTPSSRPKTAVFGSVLLKGIYGTDRMLGALKVCVQGFLRSL